MTNPPTDPDAFNYRGSHVWPPPPPRTPLGRHAEPEAPTNPVLPAQDPPTNPAMQAPPTQPPPSWQHQDRTTNPDQTRYLMAQPQAPAVGATHIMPVTGPVPVTTIPGIPVVQSGATTAPAPVQGASRPFWQTWWVWVIGLVAILFLSTPSTPELRETVTSQNGTSCEVVEPAPQPDAPAAAPDTAPERP